MGLECRRTLLSRCWTSSGTALERRASTIKRHYRAERATRYVGDRQARAIGLKDAGRRQNPAIAGGFPDQSPLSQNCRREMIKELDRLLTITDLSEMLGVPVDTLYGWPG